jgi:N-glycosylase/DNA lyase
MEIAMTWREEGKEMGEEEVCEYVRELATFVSFDAALKGLLEGIDRKLKRAKRKLKAANKKLEAAIQALMKSLKISREEALKMIDDEG